MAAKMAAENPILVYIFVAILKNMRLFVIISKYLNSAYFT